MSSSSIIECRTKVPVKLLGVWFGPELQVEKNWVDVLSRANHRIKVWSWRWLSLKWRVEVANVFIASAIIYGLTVILCQWSWFMKLKRQLFHFLGKGSEPFVGRSICCKKKLLNDRRGMFWLLMIRHALKLSYC